MANEAVTTTQVTNILEQEFAPELLIAANEEKVVTRDFISGREVGVSQIGNRLNIGIVGVQAVANLAGTAAADGTSLVYNQIVETNKTVDPDRWHSSVQPTKNVMTRLMRYPAWKAAVKKQLVAALKTKIDVVGAALGSSLTSVTGGVGQNITESLLTTSTGLLSTQAKEHFSVQDGKLAYLCVWPKQIRHIMALPGATSALVRGDKENPIVRGWVWQAYGMRLAESGNIKTAGGLAYNMLYVKPAMALAYNEEPNLIPEQVTGLATRIIATAEFGVVILFNDYAVVIQTTDA